ncbi:TusA-related sulfurtransferase [Nicoletella semolina]|uniref:TusA-related sulfurtransferase n=1 Tax=Nicoletella semolina TaxID=271160 RepID=A0A4R2NAT4_9PAST|nr:sulfurtransferase TusA family protein [Nicoletella semolina]MDH2923990.1 hypothetical protein [Nicoletella semolina]TCP18124.1 TusA-related sulfurtransferase [Nicoletella semolina]
MNDIELDLSSYLCPEPILITKKVMEKLANGQKLVISINATTSFTDFQLLCEKYGYQAISLDERKLIIYR